MHAVLRSLLTASLALSAVVAPAATPAWANHCYGSVTFGWGTPSDVPRGEFRWVDIQARFYADGPGYIAGHCEVGAITTCQLFVNDSPIPATCRSYETYSNQCGASGCTVDITGRTYVYSDYGSRARVVLGITWGTGPTFYTAPNGPEARGEGEWWIAEGPPGQLDVLEPVCDFLDQNPNPIVGVDCTP